jgi:citronellyl-CoA dehydrogenase
MSSSPAAEYDAFRKLVRDVVARDVAPYVDQWEEQGWFPAHQLFARFGDAGLLGVEYAVEDGGQGGDHWHTVVLCEEFGRIDGNAIPMAFNVQAYYATASLAEHGTTELKQRWLAPSMRGELVASIAVSEPDAGSDVAAISTRAVRDGDHWVINGSKTFITNGQQSDWLCLLARTSDEAGVRGLSQIVVPTDHPGFRRGAPLRKLGNKASDTAQLFFDDVRVPVSNTIGEVGRGFYQQMHQFDLERLTAVYQAVGQMQFALERTRGYVLQRRAFGQPLAANQHLQYVLAELFGEVEMLREYTYACASCYLDGEDVTRVSANAKLRAGRLARAVADTCLQFHGGFGYLEDSWVSRYFRDSRLLSIGGGADEVLLRILTKQYGLEPKGDNR